MNETLKHDLLSCDTDIETAIARFSGDEGLYTACLLLFLKDPTLDDMRRALAVGDWDGAFTAAHALKGLAGNMGFVPLFLASAEMVTIIRTGRVRDVSASFRTLENCYTHLRSVIRSHCESSEIPTPSEILLSRVHPA